MIEPKYPVRRIATKLDDYAETLRTWLKADASRNKRERRTKGQMWQDLCALGYIGGYGQVCAFARAWATSQSLAVAKGAFIPLKFRHGEAFQFDWSTEYTFIGGLRRRVELAHTKLCASRAFWLVMPQARLGADLALRHALEIDTYDMYCGHTCSLVAVDVQATAQAFVRLFQSPELRKQLGQAGRQRAREVYDWAVIIAQYEALWAQLGEMRQAQAPTLKALPQPWPARIDPFHAFASYPTALLTPQTVLGLVDADVHTAFARVGAYRQLAMVNFAQVVLPTDAEVQAVLQAAASPRPAMELVQAIPAERQAFVFRALVWLVKLGVVRVVRVVV